MQGLSGAVAWPGAASPLRVIVSALLVGWIVAASEGTAAAQNYGRLTVIEDNDGLLPDKWDRHYTQGAMLAYLSPALSAGDLAWQLYDRAGSALPVFGSQDGITRKFSVVVGQSIFTPTDYHRAVPDPLDRPFAGWLYAGGSLLQETGGVMLENFEVLAGVVGPDSLAQEAQEGFHSAAGVHNRNRAQAWTHQLKNEPGFMVSYDRHWKVFQSAVLGVQTDVIPDAGVTVGNVLTDAEAGVLLRIGQNLGVDYGVARIRPALSGTNWFNAARLDGSFGWYVFAGAQGRAVAHNIFLDGNSAVSSPSVHKNVLVGDFSTGLSLFWADWVKLDASFTERSKEFRSQAQADHFGSVNLSVRF